MNELVTQLGRVEAIFVEHPGLRRYFYEGAAAPTTKRSDDHDADLQSRLVTMAGLFADILDVAIDSTQTLEPTRRNHPDWEDFAKHLLAQSPILRDQLSRHPAWWPRLATLSGVTRAAER